MTLTARLVVDRGEAMLPGVHRIASVTKRCRFGTHQGSVDEAYLQAYLDEFMFRFNRGAARCRGLVSTTSSRSSSPTNGALSGPRRRYRRRTSEVSGEIVR